MLLLSNVVPKEKMREIQKETLNVLSNSLKNSFGPFGSNTIICKDINNGSSVKVDYTKDGHTIIKNILFNGVIEESVKEDLISITDYITKTVGDGTTSAILLSNIIFGKLIELERDEDLSPQQLIDQVKEYIEKIKNDILSKAKKFDYNVAYNIALVSTNGNKQIASIISDLYKQFGNEIHIDVKASLNGEHMIKQIDGMNIEAGIANSCFINNNNGSCKINNANIYYFIDPIDTPEMVTILNSIIEHNILNFYASKDPNRQLLPTVILATGISRDVEVYLNTITQFMNGFTSNLQAKPPLAIISNITQRDQLDEIAIMCGCKAIKKYINKDQQESDIERGLAPTPKTAYTFCGKAEVVESDEMITKFINPLLMRDEKGEYTEVFKGLLSTLESGYSNAKKENDILLAYNYKKRLNSLKGLLVEYYVGGISQSERDALKDLVDDAVLNCRSASKDGYGYGANIEGFISAIKLYDGTKISDIIKEAYFELVKTLLRTCMNDEEAEKALYHITDVGMPMNIKTKEIDPNIITSIMGDVVILESVCKIVSIMFTSNQFLTPTALHNRYGIQE